MSGHIRNKGKRQDGSTKWEARWRNPLNPAERREKMFRAKERAARWLSDLDTQTYQGTLIEPSRAVTPLSDIAAEWADTWLDLEPKTIAGYDHILRKHVLPRFGNQPIHSIRPDLIQAWVGELSQGPPRRNPTTVRNIYAVLRGLMKFAVERRYIATNPCEAVRLPKRRNRQAKRHLYLTPQEVNELSANLPAPYDTAVYVAAYCGLRAGELWALRREDIDLLNGTISVSRALKEVYSSNPDLATGLIVGAPKSRASNRVVSIPRRSKRSSSRTSAKPSPAEMTLSRWSSRATASRSGTARSTATSSAPPSRGPGPPGTGSTASASTICATLARA